MFQLNSAVHTVKLLTSKLSHLEDNNLIIMLINFNSSQSPDLHHYSKYSPNHNKIIANYFMLIQKTIVHISSDLAKLPIIQV
ncbi:hypothetical protein BpHYR1_003277 [Brachionus plicatilis]|uniref:Uncharacterized protein n=1 Tax=Brachionus plicatilis TaxID=10195 RepID=A0A3M7QBX4_BRAPC|nr:hypothetical protein BpHYR1_003277 [Brachionus plicatilis]